MSGSPLRVGLLGARWTDEPGGVETVLATEASELLRRGQAVFALALDTRELAPGEVRDRREDGVAVRRVGRRPESLRALGELTRSPELERLTARWCAETRVDVLHVHHLGGWGLGLPPRLSELGVPLVLTLHDYWPLCPRGQLFSREAERCAEACPERCAACWTGTWPHLRAPRDPRAAVAERLAAARAALEAVDALLVPSAAAREVYARHGIDERRLAVCENGVVVPKVERRDRAPGVPLRVGCLGAVQPSKGVLELARLVEGLGEELSFELHGPLEPYHGDRAGLDALEALAARSERVRLHGPYARRELGAILGGLDLVVAPSRWPETHGLAAREARGGGVPVFASRIGGLDEPAAFYILPADDLEAWRRALERFARDAAWREELRAARWTPRTPAAMVDQLETLFLRLA